MNFYKYAKLTLMFLIFAALLFAGIKMEAVIPYFNLPTIETTATYHITVRPGGHVWLYEGGAYDMKLELGRSSTKKESKSCRLLISGVHLTGIVRL